MIPRRAHAAAGSGRRIDQVTGALADGKFLESFRQRHDVDVIKFDSEVHRVAALPKTADKSQSAHAPAAIESHAAAESTNWTAELEPQGSETRIAQAVRQVLRDLRGTPLSGIVVFSDGE